MSQTGRVPKAVSWPNAPAGKPAPNSKYGAVSGEGATYSGDQYPRRLLSQTPWEYANARKAAFAERNPHAYTEHVLPLNFAKMSLSGQGRKTYRRHRKTSKKLHKSRKTRKN